MCKKYFSLTIVYIIEQLIPKRSKTFQNVIYRSKTFLKHSKTFLKHSKLFQKIVPNYSKTFQNYSKTFQNVPKYYLTKLTILYVIFYFSFFLFLIFNYAIFSYFFIRFVYIIFFNFKSASGPEEGNGGGGGVCVVAPLPSGKVYYNNVMCTHNLYRNNYKKLGSEYNFYTVVVQCQYTKLVYTIFVQLKYILTKNYRLYKNCIHIYVSIIQCTQNLYSNIGSWIFWNYYLQKKVGLDNCLYNLYVFRIFFL